MHVTCRRPMGFILIKQMGIKLMAQEKDVVLIYFENSPMAFARIESITADHKRGWYHVKFLLLQVPCEAVTWILRDTYIDGEEFTMNGKKMRIDNVVCPEDPFDEYDKHEETSKDDRKQEGGAEIITFRGSKK